MPDAARVRVAVVSPVVQTDAINVEATLRPLGETNVDIENFSVETGSTSIETATDIERCRPGLLAVGKGVTFAVCRALVINCMCDLGLRELRSRIKIPVFGPRETSMHTIAAAAFRCSMS